MRRRTPRFVAVRQALVLRAVILLVLAAASVAGVGVGSARAHALISVIDLTVVGGGPSTTVRAAVHYPDHDPVVGETVVGVAYSASTGRTVVLALSPDPRVAAEWVASPHLGAGGWQVEVDAVAKTTGLQSIGFTVSADGEVTDVVTPSPLPAAVVVPGSSPAVAAGLHVSEARSASTCFVVLALALLAVALAQLVWWARRRARAVVEVSSPLAPGDVADPVDVGDVEAALVHGTRVPDAALARRLRKAREED